MQEDWNGLARSFGYESYKDLLIDLYQNDGLTMKQICQKIKCTIPTLSRHLNDFNIPKRRPGGAQNLSKKKWRLFRLDPRMFWSLSNENLASVMKMDKSTIYKTRREIIEHANGNHQSDSRTGEILNA